MGLNHDAGKIIPATTSEKGDPTEVALVEYAMQQENFDSKWWENSFPRKQELPFDSDRKNDDDGTYMPWAMSSWW